MNVQRLRELLEGLDDETEVRLMTQSGYPFEYSILGTWVPAPDPDACEDCGLTSANPIHDEDPDRDDSHTFQPYDNFTPGDSDPGTRVVYLVEGTQLGYGSSAAFEEVER